MMDMEPTDPEALIAAYRADDNVFWATAEGHWQNVLDYLLEKRDESTERARVVAWLDAERAYQEGKASRGKDDESLRTEGLAPDSMWRDHITMYLHRAHVLGLNTPSGRQAVMKSAATALACCESMWRVYGEPPKPGVPSGVINGG